LSATGHSHANSVAPAAVGIEMQKVMVNIHGKPLLMSASSEERRDQHFRQLDLAWDGNENNQRKWR
jgi:hypothetical protein